MKKIFVFTFIAMLMASCLPGNVQIPQSPLLKTLERKSGLIAYIGIDGNMYVSDQGGGNLTQLTKDANLPETQSNTFRYYQLPAWSLDGNQLAFVGMDSENDRVTSGIWVANVNENNASRVYASESERPVYLYWSPDNANVSLISSSTPSQSLILQNIPADGGDRTVIDTGSPYYWSWAPDGSTMIVHAGGAANSASPDHLAFLRMDSEIVEYGLDSEPASFQSPAWSPDGSHILLTRLNDQNEKEIVLTDGRGAFQKTVGKFDLNTAFAWSSDSSRAAFIDGAQAMNGAGVMGSLHVIDIETTKEIAAVDDNVIAFFWSPDGQKIAYFLPVSASQTANGSQSGNQQFLVQLNMLDVATGESRELFTYQPTGPFANILPYFDQYHHSATIWSPDNNNLVLSFTDGNGTPSIAVVAASGQLQPRLLAEGYLAFWSWK